MASQLGALRAFFRLSPQTRRLVEAEITKDPDSPVLIGEAAVLCGVCETTLRRYEKAGKIGPLPRDSRGRRLFDNDALFAVMNTASV